MWKRVWISVLFSVLLLSPSVGMSHLTPDTGRCFNLKKAVRLVPPFVLESNGLIGEAYDTDGDGKPDLITMSHAIDGTKTLTHKAAPLFYLVDHNRDGKPDALYIDKVGSGKCVDIVLYEDLTKPHDRGLMFQEKTKADRGKSI